MNHHVREVTSTQVHSFRQKGYAFLPNYFSAPIVQRLRSISDEMSSEAISILESALLIGESLSTWAKMHPLELVVVPEAHNPRQVCRYEFMMGRSLAFKSFVARYVQPAVSKLVGRAVVPFKDKTNEKLPGGGAFRPHQDFAAYQFFAPRYYITALLTIDPATLMNGCIQVATNVASLTKRKRGIVIENIQGRSLLHYDTRESVFGDIRADIHRNLHWKAIEAMPSDLLVFDSFVPHYSKDNQSLEPRRAAFVTFNFASAGSFYDAYYAEKRLNYHHSKFHVSTPTLHAP